MSKPPASGPGRAPERQSLCARLVGTDASTAAGLRRLVVLIRCLAVYGTVFLKGTVGLGVAAALALAHFGGAKSALGNVLAGAGASAAVSLAARGLRRRAARKDQ